MGTDWLSIGYLVFTEYSDSIVSQEYEDWKSYKTGLDNIGGRLELYREKAHKVYLLEPGDVNYDLTPTLKLQIENLERLAKHPAPVDFNLLRTENELKELLEYVDSGKEYVKLKRGRIKFGYISEIDSTVQPYDVLIPNSYDPSRKYALMLSLHGYQNEIQKYTDLVRDVTKSALDSLGIIKVALYGRRNHSYLGAAEEDVLTVLTRVQARYSIDSDRVYLTGSSMGGYGTWFIGLNYPHLFAAVSPVCAPSMFGGTPFLNSISPIEYISNARNLPARIYHGAMDSTVNVENSHRMADRLKEMQYDYVYTEYPDVGHDSWNRADADGDRLPWLLKYTRNPYAAQVQHKAFYLRYGRAYWLRITGKGDWNKFSEIQGEITGKNEISIHTNNVSSFSIDARHPSLNPDDPLRVIIDGDSLAIDDHPEGLDFHALTKSEWTAGKPSEKGLVKKLGMEGPFGAVETGPFLLVYGTGRPDKVGLLKHIGTILQNDYSDSDIEPKLVPDTLVIEGGLAEKYHLYLIGSPDENIYLKRIVSRLPVSFSKDSMMFNGVYSRLETGFKMIYPNPEQTDKYILIDKYPEFLPGIDRLVNYPVADYLVYSLKGGRFEVLQDGYFGSDWRVAK
jgi:predicted esterase